MGDQSQMRKQKLLTSEWHKRQGKHAVKYKKGFHRDSKKGIIGSL